MAKETVNLKTNVNIALDGITAIVAVDSNKVMVRYTNGHTVTIENMTVGEVYAKVNAAKRNL